MVGEAVFTVLAPYPERLFEGRFPTVPRDIVVDGGADHGGARPLLALGELVQGGDLGIIGVHENTHLKPP